MRKALVNRYFIAAMVSLAAFIAYLPALQNDFVNWDDDFYIYKNAFIRTPDVAFLKWAFFDFYAANWHPLTWISHALDYSIWGLNPMGHHLTNNILHSVNTFLVVLLIVRLIESGKQYAVSSKQSSGKIMGHEVNGKLSGAYSLVPTAYLRFTLIAAGVTGLLFGLHPLQVESVAWISERKNLLYALFFLLSIMAYTRYATYAKGIEQSAKDTAIRAHSPFLFALCFFILALMSKPMAVTLPFVLLILDWYPFGRIQSLRSFRPVFIEKIPFIVLSLISAILTVLAQEMAGATVSLEYAPLSVRAFIAAKALIAYLRNVVLPLNLLPFYVYPRVVQIFSLEYLLPIILVVGMTITSVVIAKKQKLWLAVWGYYVITLLPVIGIIRVGSQEMADRYAYLPCLGFFLIIGSGTAWAWEKMDSLKRYGSAVKILSAVIAVTAFVGISFFTVRQIGIWKNSDTLWSRVIEKEPAAATKAYRKRASYFYDINRFDKACEDYDMLLSIDPSNYEAFIMRKISVEALLDRGNFYLRKGDKNLAGEDFQNACRFGNDAGCAALKALGTDTRIRGK